MFVLGFAAEGGHDSGLHIEINAPKINVPILGETSISLVTSFFIVLFLVGFCLFVNARVKHFKDVPGKFQLLIEMLVGWIDRFSKEQVGAAYKQMAPYVLAIGSFIICGCLIELFGFRPVPADFNMPIALALMSFFLINYISIRYEGLKHRLKSYIQPMALVAPFKLISDLAAPVSLACRLFGNVLAGMIVMELVYHAMGYFAVVVPAALSVYFTLFHAGIQAYIFMMLSLSYVKEAMEGVEE